MIDIEAISQALERVFSRIHLDRMQGVPILNEALHVEAVGFIHWHGHPLGVLITPWFMNLTLLPCEGAEWEALTVGEKVTHVFPSGAYEFIVGHEEGLGRYQMCSLFSPVFEFSNQETAIATAEAVMLGLMDVENLDQTSMRGREIERIWYGEPEAGELNEEELPEVLQPLEVRLEQPMSRRDLLRGKFL